ncbi:MAG: patatin-like phospholipase family protein [bacterium]
MFRPKIGLALGGGGPKGLAHVGVIKALEKNNIPIDYIAGTSVGSLIGGFYAYSKDIASIEAHIMNKNWLQMISYFADPSLKGGFIEGNRMEQFLEEYLHSATFSDTKIPYQATAVDIQTGSLVNLHAGSLSRAIRASCAVPILFKPIEIDNHFYLDGGLLSSVPVETVKKMGADIVIAVQLNRYYEPHENWNTISIPEIGELALNIIEGKIANEEVKQAQFIIRPLVAHVHWNHLLQQDKKEAGIKLGEESANKIMPLITLTVNKNKIELALHEWINKIKKLF